MRGAAWIFGITAIGSISVPAIAQQRPDFAGLTSLDKGEACFHTAFHN